VTHPMFDPARRCTPVTDWPEADQAAWRIALAPQDPFEPEAGFASRWAPSTRRKIETGYGRWLGWLERSELLDPCSTPASRVTRERVRAYLAMLQAMQCAPYTVANHLQDLGDALRAMAPSGDWAWILKAAGRVHQQARPIKDFHARMRPAEEVLQLGLDLMDAAEHQRFRTPHDRAVLFRDGLTLAALIHRPLRIMNFAAITIGRNLQRRGDKWWLSFSKEEVKTKRPLECTWPEALYEQLDHYLDVHRPALLDGAESEALWVAKGGAGMSTTVLAYRITKRTEDEFGKSINPHMFRHIAATTIATDDPENITGVAGVLGHSTLETSEKHYNKAKMVDAGRRYQSTVKSARKSRGRIRPSGQGELGL
jgi:integrase/recombinase XerD